MRPSECGSIGGPTSLRLVPLHSARAVPQLRYRVGLVEYEDLPHVAGADIVHHCPQAIRIARQAGLTVVSCPELVKRWADTTLPDQATLIKVLQDIQVLAQFRPNSTMPEHQWWADELAKAGP